MRHLLENGTQIYVTTEASQNALMNACHHGDVNIIKLLVAFGMDVNATKLVSEPVCI